MKGLRSSSGKKLSIFELERQNIAGCFKQTFCLHFSSKVKHDFSSYLRGILNERKNNCRWKWFHETELYVWLHLEDILVPWTINSVQQSAASFSSFYIEPHMLAGWLKYGFCNKSFRKDETLTSWQLKKSKFWEPFGSYKLNNTANPADLP